jgi:hypothetical protein
MDLTAEVQFPAGTRDISIFHKVQIGSGTHRASYTMDIGGSFSGDKAAVRAAGHLISSNAQVKISGAIPPFFHISSCCNVYSIKRRDFAFYIYNTYR